MNLLEGMLRDLNIDYIIIDNNKNIISSTTNDEELIMNVIKNSKSDSIFKYKDKFYKCGTKTDGVNTIYYIQDVSELENKYNCLKKDSLTKLFIRNIAMPLIDEYIINSIQNGESFSIIMSDIDYFKTINDTYGHDAGDKVLKDIALTFLNRFRTRDNYSLKSTEDLRKKDVASDKPKDILCRYGGEEFLILLKNINLKNTLKRIEEVRALIEEKGIVTLSFGICNVDATLLDKKITKENIEEVRNSLIKMADKSLYCSKNGGRNKICFFDVCTNEYKFYDEDLKIILK